MQPIFAALDYSSVYVTSGTYGCRLGDAKTLNCKGILFEPLTNFGTNCIITTQLFCSYVVYHHKSFMWHFSFCWSLFRYVHTIIVKLGRGGAWWGLCKSFVILDLSRNLQKTFNCLFYLVTI